MTTPRSFTGGILGKGSTADHALSPSQENSRWDSTPEPHSQHLTGGSRQGSTHDHTHRPSLEHTKWDVTPDNSLSPLLRDSRWSLHS